MTEPVTGICEPFNDKALNILSKVLQAEMKYISMTLNQNSIMSVKMLDDTAANKVASDTEDELTEQHTEGWDLINNTTLIGPFIRSVCSESSVTLADDFISAPYAGLSSPS
jgi:uncharacterized protein YjaG (DUF416 family)